MRSLMHTDKVTTKKHLPQLKKNERVKLEVISSVTKKYFDII